MTTEKDRPEIEEIDCLEAIDNLYAYLDDELHDEKTLAKFKNHIDHCQSCYSRKELETALSDRIKKSGSGEAPEAVKNRLLDIIDNLS